MRLSKLHIHQLRNIESISLEPSEGLTLLLGPNGSGKTSILEAIYLLGNGKSFRHYRQNPLVRFDQDKLTVFGQLSEGGKLGVEKVGLGGQTYHIDGEKVDGRLELIKKLPTHLINPDSFRLLEDGPANRRQFLDWGMFHVEHSYLGLWQKMNKALKQRNALLKSPYTTSSAFVPWETLLVEASLALDELRAKYIAELQQCFAALLQDLLPLSVDLSYERGWPADLDLAAHYRENRGGDVARGFTQMGPHRGDLVFEYEGRAAVATLSRGQQKLVVSALHLAQGVLYNKKTGDNPLFLVDDLASELDATHRRRFLSLLASLQAQVFVTGVEQGLLADTDDFKAVKMFHVEHGEIRPLAQSVVQ